MRLVGRFDRGVRVLRGLAGGLAREDPGEVSDRRTRGITSTAARCASQDGRARASKPLVRTTTILKSAWSLAREARRSFLLASRRLRETPPIWRSGARGHIRPRAMGDESPPDPAPLRLATTAVAPPRLATTAVDPPARGDSPPAGATTRAAAAAPRAEMIAARPPATDPPVTAAAADARPASPGDGTLAVSVRVR